jgi:glycosyltransferase involved in cell wall biosynthesis
MAARDDLTPRETGMAAQVRPHPAVAPNALPPELAGLRVALVHDWLTGRRGGEKCLEVACRAFPDAILHTLIHRPGAAGPIIDGMVIRTSPLQRVPGIDRRYRLLLPLMPAAARAWRVGEVDLVVSFSHCVAKAVRVPPGVPHVCYCFTPMRYAWDGRAAYLGNWDGKAVRRALAGWTLDRLRAWDRASARGVTHFVAISETVRERIARCYGRASHVISPPVDVDYYTPAEVEREPFYLVVSALVPYKRVEHAVLACASARRRLIVIGEGPELARLRSIAGATTSFLGWQPDAVIRDHLRRCRALLFPGVEDFGIVPIEALACGTPVIALGDGGVAETVDGAVGRVYADPTPDGLRDAIEGWETDGLPHDPPEARRRAEAFALPRFRERLLGHLADVVRGRAPATGWPPDPHYRRRQHAGDRSAHQAL